MVAKKPTNSKPSIPNQSNSEIDDIFSSKPTKIETQTDINTDMNSSTIQIETMDSISKKIKQAKVFLASDLIGTRQNQKIAVGGDEGAFGDSRGVLTTKRKTEDGLRLFDVKDLVADGGGGIFGVYF